MKIDINKKYRYRNGKPARILCVDAPGDQPVISINNEGSVHGHEANGNFYPYGGSSRSDLIEVREPREWKAVVVTNDARLPDGTLANYDEGDEDNPRYEVIRVREIIN